MQVDTATTLILPHIAMSTFDMANIEYNRHKYIVAVSPSACKLILLPRSHHCTAMSSFGRKTTPFIVVLLNGRWSSYVSGRTNSLLIVVLQTCFLCSNLKILVVFWGEACRFSDKEPNRGFVKMLTSTFAKKFKLRTEHLFTRISDDSLQGTGLEAELHCRD